MNKPKIGVLSLYDTKKDSKWNSLWMFPGYPDGIIAAGGMPMMLPLLSEEADIRALASMFDGFLFTGGQDIDPARYGQPLYHFCNEVSPERDHMELILMDELRKQDKSVLGVCRGLQLINVAFGGTLYQDLVQQKNNPNLIQHGQKTEFFFPVHDVDISEGSILHGIAGADSIRVNSMHHQGIDSLGDGVVAVARAADGVVEAIEVPEMRFCLALQWHPEFLWSRRDFEFDIFKAFVKACS
ncbi:MAG: gamma-glutamyl-gamma-aminobutyrate hydrolase family protein [Eubacterium sp.]|nr:gamma-glutamyl-gamma-aminobutyrate hydrolase family protein [Eubacterium sp.]